MCKIIKLGLGKKILFCVQDWELGYGLGVRNPRIKGECSRWQWHLSLEAKSQVKSSEVCLSKHIIFRVNKVQCLNLRIFFILSSFIFQIPIFPIEFWLNTFQPLKILIVFLKLIYFCHQEFFKYPLIKISQEFFNYWFRF